MFLKKLYTFIVSTPILKLAIKLCISAKLENAKNILNSNTQLYLKYNMKEI